MVGKVARRPDRREMSARLAPRRFLPLRGACRRPPPDAPRLRVPLILTRNEGEERNARLDAAKAAAPYCQARLTPLPFLIHSLILDARSEYQAAEETRKLDSGSPS